MSIALHEMSRYRLSLESTSALARGDSSRSEEIEVELRRRNGAKARAADGFKAGVLLLGLTVAVTLCALVLLGAVLVDAIGTYANDHQLSTMFCVMLIGILGLAAKLSFRAGLRKLTRSRSIAAQRASSPEGSYPDRAPVVTQAWEGRCVTPGRASAPPLS